MTSQQERENMATAQEEEAVPNWGTRQPARPATTTQGWGNGRPAPQHQPNRFRTNREQQEPVENRLQYFLLGDNFKRKIEVSVDRTFHTAFPTVIRTDDYLTRVARAVEKTKV